MSTESTGSIVCTPSAVLPGPSVLVEGTPLVGPPDSNTEWFYIGINGILGSRQYLRFIRPRRCHG